MMEPFLFRTPILPVGFSFPTAYEEMMVNDAWPVLEPWDALATNMAKSLSYYGGILLKFPHSPLIPFAIISDQSGFWNDGYVVLACFDGADLSGDPRVRIYDYGAPKASPWENMSYPNFLAWVEAAKKESALYIAEKKKIEQDD